MHGCVLIGECEGVRVCAFVCECLHVYVCGLFSENVIIDHGVVSTKHKCTGIMAYMYIENKNNYNTEIIKQK